MNTRPKLLLFDLGGVLVELGDEPIPNSWFPNNQTFGLREWFSSDHAQAFESGAISVDEFIHNLKSSLALNATEQDILAAFKGWPQGLFARTPSLLSRLPADYRVAALSNCNEVHAPILLHEFGLVHMLEHIFFSHEIGCSKPDPQAFYHVLKSLDCAPSDVVFFDDNLANVQAANDMGIQAHQVFGPADIENII